MLLFIPILLLLFSSTYAQETDWFGTQSPDNCPGPRVRQAWSNLSPEDQLNYVNLLWAMKTNKITVRQTGTTTTTRDIYDLFVDYHSNSVNAALWHGTTAFLMTHRYLLWRFENALRYTARVYGPSLNPPITDPCNISVPYWNWEVDYENDTKDGYSPQEYSSIWNANYFGSFPAPIPTYNVTTGRFNHTSWVTNYATNENPSVSYFSSSAFGALTYSLKRLLNNTATPLTVSPITIISNMNSTPNYDNFDAWVEGGPHSTIHIWLSFQMQTMSSPDEVLFWLHHANIDRIFALWQDCWDYELIAPQAITPAQYNGSNPNPGPPTKTNPAHTDPNSKAIFNCSTDSQIVYWWKAATLSGGVPWYEDTLQFPNATWPRYRDMHSMGNEFTPGYQGMWYVYGPDNIVELIESLGTNICPYNTAWRLVNQPVTLSKKRDTENHRHSNKSRHEQQIVSILSNYWNSFLNGSLTEHEAFKELEKFLCSQSPCIEINDEVEAWVEMNGLTPDQFNTICDSFSDRYKKHKQKKARNTLNSELVSFRNTTLPFLRPVMVTTIVVTVLVVTGLVGIAYYSKRKQIESDELEFKLNVYLEM